MRDPRLIAVVAVGLVVGAVTTGLAGQTQGWPFACYPTFADSPGRFMPALEIVRVEGGVEQVVPPRLWTAPSDAQPLWGEIWSITGPTGPVDPAALERLWQRIARRNGFEPDIEVRFYRATLDVTPDSPRPVSRGPLLHVSDPR